jgi:hypothetical protein
MVRVEEAVQFIILDLQMQVVVVEEMQQ